MADAGTAQCQCKDRSRVPVAQVAKNKQRLRSQLLSGDLPYCHDSTYAHHTNNAYGLANVAQGVTAVSGIYVAGCITTQGNGRKRMPASPFPREEKKDPSRYALYNKVMREKQAKREGLTQRQLDKKQRDSLAQKLGYPDHKWRIRVESRKKKTDTQPERTARPLYPPVSRKMPDEHIAQAVWREWYIDWMTGAHAGTKTLILTPHAIPCAQPPSILEAFPEVTSDEMDRLLSAPSPELPHTI
jgi:hypothetical protein